MRIAYEANKLRFLAINKDGTLLTSNVRTGALDGSNSDNSYTSTCATDVNCGTQSVLSVPGSGKIYATSGLRLYRVRCIVIPIFFLPMQTCVSYPLTNFLVIRILLLCTIDHFSKFSLEMNFPSTQPPFSTQSTTNSQATRYRLSIWRLVV